MPFKTPSENPAPYDSPRSFGLPYEDVYLTAEDGVRLHGWFVPAVGRDRGTAPTVVFFHGNAMNIGFRLPNVAVLCQDLGVNGEHGGHVCLCPHSHISCHLLPPPPHALAPAVFIIDYRWASFEKWPYH
jgi:hypothetical protein